MSDNKIFGFHSSFYYFGTDHLFINVCPYINSGVARKEFICICSNDKIYQIIYNNSNISSSNSYRISDLFNILKIYKKYGSIGIKDKLLEYEEKILCLGYSGLRIIADAGYIISQISKNHFLDVDSCINDIIRGTRSSVMCIYDFNEYLNGRGIINDQVIEESYKTHFHRLYRNKIMESKELLNI